MIQNLDNREDGPGRESVVFETVPDLSLVTEHILVTLVVPEVVEHVLVLDVICQEVMLALGKRQMFFNYFIPDGFVIELASAKHLKNSIHCVTIKVHGGGRPHHRIFCQTLTSDQKSQALDHQTVLTQDWDL